MPYPSQLHDKITELDQAVAALRAERDRNPDASAQDLDELIEAVRLPARSIMVHAESIANTSPLVAHLESALDVIPDDADSRYRQHIQEWIQILKGEVSVRDRVDELFGRRSQPGERSASADAELNNRSVAELSIIPDDGSADLL